MKKRVFCFLLVLTMLFSMIPASAFAEGTPTLAVSAQSGAAYCGEVSTVSYDITASDFEAPPASYIVSWYTAAEGGEAASLPAGVECSANSSSQISFTVSDSAEAGTYYFTVSCEEPSVESPVASLVVSLKPTIVVSEQSDIVHAHIDSEVSYTVTAENFVTPPTGYTINWFTDRNEYCSCDAPEGLTVTTNNGSELVFTTDSTFDAYNYYFKLTDSATGVASDYVCFANIGLNCRSPELPELEFDFGGSTYWKYLYFYQYGFNYLSGGSIVFYTDETGTVETPAPDGFNFYRYPGSINLDVYFNNTPAGIYYFRPAFTNSYVVPGAGEAGSDLTVYDLGYGPIFKVTINDLVTPVLSTENNTLTYGEGGTVSFAVSSTDGAVSSYTVFRDYSNSEELNVEGITVSKNDGETLEFTVDSTVPAGTYWFNLCYRDGYHKYQSAVYCVIVAPAQITGLSLQVKPAEGEYAPITAAAVAGDTVKAVLSDEKYTAAYQWYRGSAAISGATSCEYTLVEGDNTEENYIWVQVQGNENYAGVLSASATAALYRDEFSGSVSADFASYIKGETYFTGDENDNRNYVFAGWFDGDTELTSADDAVFGKIYLAKWKNESGKYIVTSAQDYETLLTTDKLETEGWKWDSSTRTLTLDGYSLELTDPSVNTGIYLEDSSEIVLAGKNAIRGVKYGIDVKGILSVNGDGALYINSSDTGIYSSSNLNVNGSEITVKSATSTAIYSSSYTDIKNAVIDANGTTGFYSSNNCTVTDSTINATGTSNGFYSNSKLSINSSNITGINTGSSGNGVYVSYYATIYDSEISGTGPDYGVYFDYDVTVSNSTVIGEGREYGIFSDDTMKVNNNSKVKGTAADTGLCSERLYVNDSKVEGIGTDEGSCGLYSSYDFSADNSEITGEGSYCGINQYSSAFKLTDSTVRATASGTSGYGIYRGSGDFSISNCDIIATGEQQAVYSDSDASLYGLYATVSNKLEPEDAEKTSLYLFESADIFKDSVKYLALSKMTSSLYLSADGKVYLNDKNGIELSSSKAVYNPEDDTWTLTDLLFSTTADNAIVLEAAAPKVALAGSCKIASSENVFSKEISLSYDETTTSIWVSDLSDGTDSEPYMELWGSTFKYIESISPRYKTVSITWIDANNSEITTETVPNVPTSVTIDMGEIASIEATRLYQTYFEAFINEQSISLWYINNITHWDNTLIKAEDIPMELIKNVSDGSGIKLYAIPANDSYKSYEYDENISYLINDKCIDVRAYYNNRWIKTAYEYSNGSFGYYFESSDDVEILPEKITAKVIDGQYVLFAVTAKALENTAEDSRAGIWTDVMIGDNDYSAVEAIVEDDKIVGFMLTDEHTDCNSASAQYRCYVGGSVLDAAVGTKVKQDAACWFGYYGSADDHWADELNEDTADGTYINDYKTLVDTDSGFAASWSTANMTAGQEKVFYVYFGVVDSTVSEAPRFVSDIVIPEYDGETVTDNGFVTVNVANVMSSESKGGNINLSLTTTDGGKLDITSAALGTARKVYYTREDASKLDGDMVAVFNQAQIIAFPGTYYVNGIKASNAGGLYTVEELGGDATIVIPTTLRDRPLILNRNKDAGERREGWSYDAAKNEMTVQGMDLTIDDTADPKVAIQLPEDTAIVLNTFNDDDGNPGSSKISTGPEGTGINMTTGDVNLEGDGSLEINGGTGIKSNGDVIFNTDGDIVIKASDTCISAPNGDIYVLDGTLTLTIDEDGKFISDGTKIYIAPGYYVEGGEIDKDHHLVPDESATTIKILAHTHKWNYSAEGAVITAKCDCGLVDTLEIKEPEVLEYTGEALDAVLDFVSENEKTLPSLLEGDHTITYKYKATSAGEYADTTDNSNAGYYIATVTVSKVSASVSYKVEPKDITGGTAYLSGSALYADGKEKTQLVEKVTLEDWTPTITFTVSDNTNTEPGKYTLTVTGNGNYTGSVEKTYVILAQPDPEAEPIVEKVDTDYGTGSVSLTVEVEEAVPPTALDMAPSEAINATATAEELSLVAEGATLDIWMEVDPIDESTYDTEIINKIEEASSKYDVACYLDISLYKKFSNEENATNITKTNAPITITVTVPEELRNETYSYAIARYHEGNVTIIKGVYDAETGKLTFETDLFCEFALLINDNTAPVCSADYIVKFNEFCPGQYKMFINNTDTGEYTFKLVCGGYTIQNVETGKYVCLENGAIVMRDSNPTAWAKDLASFHVSVVTTNRYWFFGWRVKTSVTVYYLNALYDGTITATLLPGITHFAYHIERDEHCFTYCSNGDGTHTATCSICGEQETETCSLNENDRCTLCGYRIAGSVTTTCSVSVVKTYNANKLIRFLFGNYTYTAVITAKCDGSGVARVEYSTDGSCYNDGCCYSAYSNIPQLWVRITDANGTVTNWYYSNGSTAPAN